MKNYGQYHKVVIDGAEYVHREYFIEQFKDRIKQNRDDFEGDEAQSAFDAAIKIINCIGPDGPEACSDEIIVEQMTDEYNNGWIPCTERLPDENQNVIACFAHGTVTELRFYDGEFHGIYHYNINVIVAWQPLPRPYIG